MGIGIWEALILLIGVLVIFGAGKLPTVMRDLGKGIKNFKDEMGMGKDAPVQSPARTDTGAASTGPAAEAGAGAHLPAVIGQPAATVTPGRPGEPPTVDLAPTHVSTGPATAPPPKAI